MSETSLISMIYPQEEPISVFDNMPQKIEAQRNKRYTADKKLLQDKGLVIDINNIQDLPDGRVRFDINSARFECVFHRGKRKKLVLVLDGARTHSGGKKRDIPIFNRWSWYPLSECSWISVEDPTYFVNDDITLAWFWGTKTENFRLYTAQLAEKLAEYLGIEKKDVVFYGGSGGGTAAIHSAALFGAGTAVSINGQVNFEYDHKDIENFKKFTGIDVREPDQFERNKLCEIMRRYTNTNYILIENCLSDWDLEDHTKYYSKKLGIDPKYGLCRFDNIYTFIYDAGGKAPHTAFEDKNLFYAVNFLTDIAASGEDIEKYKPLYRLFCEFWHSAYEVPPPSNSEQSVDISAGVTLYNSKTVTLASGADTKEDIVENITVEAANDNYKNYMYTNFAPNTMYCIEVSGVSTENAVTEHSMGLFNMSSRKFYKLDIVPLGKDFRFCFSVGSHPVKIGFCIFAGVHGKTAGNTVSIKRITVRSARLCE